MRVALIGCSKRKLASPAPACRLYRGDLFRLSVAWLEVRADVQHWGILSAKHGLVMPGDVVEPYDRYLGGVTSAERSAWCARVHDQLMARWGDGVIYMILAGAHYRRALDNMPMVEDVFGSWARARRERGLRKTGIGILKRELKAHRGFGV